MVYNTIYIICPANGKSGGSEALHQLAHILGKKGQPCFIVYVDYNTLELSYSKTPTKFRWYNLEFTTLIEDSEYNLVIIPETMTNFLNKITFARKAIWWLSVDYGEWKDEYNTNTILHFCQSNYALNFILSKGITAHLLSDFIIKYKLLNLFISKKRSLIVYDPRKENSKFTEIKKKLGSTFSFIPIKDLDRIKLSYLLAQSTIYFDLGGNPGKDRIPREAIMYNSIPIISNIGSANNEVDFPFPNTFKISPSTPTEEICKKIVEVSDQANSYIRKLINSRHYINNEKRNFNDEINQIFGLGGNFKMSIIDQIRIFIYDLKELYVNVVKPVLFKIYKGIK